jgi:selenocysteine lyase/cysteine desulfurase
MLAPFDFDALREREYGRLDAQGISYLDFAASGLYGLSQVTAQAERLAANVYGNPHSLHAPSLASSGDIARAKAAVLDFFDADPDVYEVCLTANTSAALKLVAESYPFGPDRSLVLSADNHNSVIGAREYAAARGAAITILPLDAELRLREPAARLAAQPGPGLFAFPAQSNFSGVKHDLGLVEAAQAQGYDVLLDAAAGGAVSLREHGAQFLACAFYKLFGLPTGLGALVARRSALARLRRPWFAGGTVDYVSVELARHRLRDGHEGFEDGTPDFLAAGAVETGFALLSGIPRRQLQERLLRLTGRFLDGVASLRHADGTPMVRVYGPRNLDQRGATVAFNVLRPDGSCLPYPLFEAYAQRLLIAVRGGCFCNPGAGEAAFGFAGGVVASCLDQAGARFSHARLQDCLGAGTAVGALRMSLGVPSNAQDVDRLLAAIAAFAASPGGAPAA